MEPLYQHLKMFVASPGDVAEERASVEYIVKRNVTYKLKYSKL